MGVGVDGEVAGTGASRSARSVPPGRYIRALADGKPDRVMAPSVARIEPANRVGRRREGYPSLHVQVSTILPSPRSARGMGDPLGTGCDCASVDPGGHSIAVVASPWASQV